MIHRMIDINTKISLAQVPQHINFLILLHKANFYVKQK